MAAEQVLRLLDSFWFETTILSIKTPSKFHPQVDPIISQTKVEEVLPLGKNLLVSKSHSDQNLGITPCFLSDYTPSPQHRLRTIPSGSEIREFSRGTSCENHEKEEDLNTKVIKQRHAGHGRRRDNRKGKTRSMSLTELEFKELKGFMDLGFVFSEEDKNSGLVSLIPGLQRLGSREDAGEGDDDDDDDEEQEQNIDDETVISDHKPYLSEAWDGLDRRGTRNPLQDWRVPDSGSEVDMKHSLRFWAHSVASIAR